VRQLASQNSKRVSPIHCPIPIFQPQHHQNHKERPICFQTENNDSALTAFRLIAKVGNDQKYPLTRLAKFSWGNFRAIQSLTESDPI
jgi:hypothetical protein